MKIKTQISISFIIFTLLAVVIIFSVYSSNNQLADIQKKQQVIDNIERSSFELYYLENDYLIHGGKNPVERWNAKYTELNGNLESLTLTDPSEQVILLRMFDDQKNLKTSFSDLVAVSRGGSGTDLTHSDQELKEFSASTLTGQTQSLMSGSSELSQRVKAEAREVGQRTLLIISFSIAVLMIFVLLNYLVIYRSALRSIYALQQGAERVGSGDLDMKIENTGDDELGSLSRTFNEMASSIKDSRSLLLASHDELELEITGHKRAEEALRERDSQIRALIDNLPFDTWAMDASGHYILQNPVSKELWGDFIGKTTPRVPVPAYLIVHWQENNRKVIQGTPVRGELSVSSQSGVRIYDEIVAPVRVADEIRGIIGVNIDITERKVAEDTLRRSESYLSSILRSAPIGIGVTSNRIILSVNNRICEMLGYTEEELKGKSTRIVYPTQDDYDYVGQANRTQIAESGSGSVETRWQRKDGTIMDVLLSSTPLDLSDRSAGITFTALDITARKKGENTIRESEEKFRGIFDNINDGLHIHEIEPDGRPGRFFEVNEVACRMLQFTREELMKHSPLDFTTDYHSKPLDEIFKENMTIGHSIFETGHRRKDGTIIPVEINTHVVTLQGKRVIVAVVRDITDRKRVENTLVRVNKKLNILSDLTRRDLTNQMFVLRSYLELAKNQLAGQDRIIGTVQKSAQAIRSINETIEYSKDFQDMGAKPPKWQNVRMAMLWGLSHIAIGDIQHSLETGDLEIFADPLLEKVCQRLFENSLRHGGHVTRIRVWHEVTHDGVTILFEDDGTGIPQENKEQIFLPGEGTHVSVRSLNFVREILDITGIPIRETGEPETGIRFEIAVPQGTYRFGKEQK